MKSTFIIGFLIFNLQVFSQENIKLINSNNSACDNSEDPQRFRERIISQSFSGDTLQVSIGVVTQCDLKDPQISISKNADTLDILIERKFIAEYDTLTGNTIYRSEIVECDCCYQFDLKIAGLPSFNYFFRVNRRHVEYSPEKYKTYPVRFDISSSGDTINFKDKYGLKQGYWEKTFSNGEKQIVFFKNNTPVSFKKYHSNGQLKCDCICRSNHDGMIEILDETGICQYWDNKGNQMKK